MAAYRIYKNSKIINRIEADQAFVDMLISKGDIDSAINEADLAEIDSLIFDAQTKAFISINAIIIKV